MLLIHFIYIYITCKYW